VSEKLNIINTLGHTLNDVELIDAINILVQARKDRQASNLLNMKNTLCPGDTVEFYISKRGCHARGTVEKTKTKKAIVIEEGTGISWDVPMGMLRKC